MANIWGNTSAENILEARFSWSTRKWNIWKKKNKNMSILKNTSQKYYFPWKTYIHMIYFLKILKGWPPKCFKIPFNLTRSLEISSFFYLDHFPNNLWAKRISAKKYATLKYSIKSAGLAKYFSTTYAWYLLLI